MKNRMMALLAAYRDRPEARADQSMWRFVAEKDPHLFSHHPATPAFRSHVWKIGGLYFCKGCVVTFGGFLAGILFFLATGWLHRFSDGQVGGIFLGLLLPTFLSQLPRVPRVWKHGARFLLGVLIASAFFMLFVTDSWVVQGAIAGSYFAAKIPLARLRERKNRSQ